MKRFLLLAMLVMLAMLVSSVALAGSITWTNDGGDGWDTGDRLGPDDLDTIKTEVDDNASDITNLERRRDLRLRRGGRRERNRPR